MLPASAKGIIDKHSGEPMSRRFGAVHDGIQKSKHEETVKAADHTMVFPLRAGVVVAARGRLQPQLSRFRDRPAGRYGHLHQALGGGRNPGDYVSPQAPVP